MARPNYPPRTIHLSGKPHFINTEEDGAILSVAATPGMLLESVRTAAGILRYRPSTGATELNQVAVLCEQKYLNNGVDDVEAAGNMVLIALAQPGDTFWMLIASGSTIQKGDRCQSNGDGYLKKATATTAAANVAHLKALDELGAVTTPTRCRIEVVR